MNDEPQNETRSARREPAPEPSSSTHRRRVLSFLATFALCVGLILTTVFCTKKSELPVTPAPTPEATPPIANASIVESPTDGSFDKFSHSTGAHASLACDSCHKRENNSAQPTLPGHKACTDCHSQQFFTPNHPMCAICHTSLEASNPPLKDFPRLASFNVKFDHAQHLRGGARPEAGCASCHAPMRRGVALSIPAGLAAHSNCYECHTPGANSGGRDIASCGACHSLARYARTSTNARAFAVSFSHAEHSPRQGLRCDECHNVRAGAPQSRQVTAPRPTQHFATRGQSCMTCHNNRRAFGGDDFNDCKRCHTGSSFRF